MESDPALLEEASAAYAAVGDPRKAAQALVEAMAVDPSRVTLTPKLVELYGQTDPGGCAVSRGNPPGLNPDCPLVHADICSASRNVIANYRRRGQQWEAGKIRAVAMRELGCSAQSVE